MPLKAHLQSADAIDHVHNGILPSPFHSRSSQLNINQQWGEWNGYASATYYADAHLEYFATRNTCAVFDVSPMRKYRFTGGDCPAMLDRMVTREIPSLTMSGALTEAKWSMTAPCSGWALRNSWCAVPTPATTGSVCVLSGSTRLRSAISVTISPPWPYRAPHPAPCSRPWVSPV